MTLKPPSDSTLWTKPYLTFGFEREREREGLCVCVRQGEITTSRAKHGHRGTDRERVSTWHTEQDRSSEHRDRGTEQERSAGGLVTHGHPGIFTDKRKRKEKEEPVDT